MPAERILVVEDERAVARGLRYGLEKEGFEVFWAATGAQALELTQRHAPHLILLDLRLPDLSGFDVCRRLRAAGERVRFWVQDSGPGIPAGERERVFERFYRAPGANDRAAGSGLGLAIVKAVAAAHGGSAAVASAEGQGSTFSLELPSGPPAPVNRPL